MTYQFEHLDFILLVLTQKHLLNPFLRLIESIADVLAVEEVDVEFLGELQGDVITDFLAFLNADHVHGVFTNQLAKGLRVAYFEDHELEKVLVSLK